MGQEAGRGDPSNPQAARRDLTATMNAVIATPRHAPHPMRPTTSTVWIASNRGLRAMFENSIKPSRSVMAPDNKGFLAFMMSQPITAAGRAVNAYLPRTPSTAKDGPG
jgi:hypothetical protein